jgi:hypothetical protein
MAGNAVAATTDTFTITVTCNFIGINLRNNADAADYTTWALGQLATGASAVDMTQGQGIKLVNTANVQTDITAYVSSQAANWTNDTAAGADKYLLALKAFDDTQATPDLAGAVAITGTSAPGQSVKAALAANTNQFVYAQFTVPTSTTSGAQQTIVVTIVATAS